MTTLQPLHRHADARLIVFVEGHYTERAFEMSATLTAGDFVIRPNYLAHDGIADAGARYLRLDLPQRAARDYFSTHGWHPRRGNISLSILRELTVDPDSCAALLEDTPTFALERQPPGTPMEAVAATLADAETVSLASVAEEHRLQPWELTRAFRRTFGLSPDGYRQQARLQRALKLMAETPMALTRIAAEAGFADHSHMCRALRRATGQTPGQLRRSIALC